MLSLASAKIFVCHMAVDLRKGFEGLSGIVASNFREPLLNQGSYFVFLNRGRNRMKILYWDADGLAIWYKRLEAGRFPKPQEQKTPMDRREFIMLLEGIIPKRLCKRHKL